MMGSYAYKELCYSEEFQQLVPQWEAECHEKCDGDANYDGDYWYVAAYMVERKNAEIESLHQQLADRDAGNCAPCLTALRRERVMLEEQLAERDEQLVKAQTERDANNQSLRNWQQRLIPVFTRVENSPSWASDNDVCVTVCTVIDNLTEQLAATRASLGRAVEELRRVGIHRTSAGEQFCMVCRAYWAGVGEMISHSPTSIFADPTADAAAGERWRGMERVANAVRAWRDCEDIVTASIQGLTDEMVSAINNLDTLRKDDQQ